LLACEGVTLATRDLRKDAIKHALKFLGNAKGKMGMQRKASELVFELKRR